MLPAARLCFCFSRRVLICVHLRLSQLVCAGQFMVMLPSEAPYTRREALENFVLPTWPSVLAFLPLRSMGL